MTDYAPGSYATLDGVPDGATQLAIYNHYNKYVIESDHIVAWFLVDTKFYSTLYAQVPYGHWRIQLRGKCTFAVWHETSRGDQPGVTHYLHDEVWKLGGRAIPEGFYIGVSMGDAYDCRLDSLRLRRLTPLPSDRIRKIDHSNDRVSARLVPTSY